MSILRSQVQVLLERGFRSLRTALLFITQFLKLSKNKNYLIETNFSKTILYHKKPIIVDNYLHFSHVENTVRLQNPVINQVNRIFFRLLLQKKKEKRKQPRMRTKTTPWNWNLAVWTQKSNFNGVGLKKTREKRERERRGERKMAQVPGGRLNELKANKTRWKTGTEGEESPLVHMHTCLHETYPRRVCEEGCNAGYATGRRRYFITRSQIKLHCETVITRIILSFSSRGRNIFEEGGDRLIVVDWCNSSRNF